MPRKTNTPTRKKSPELLRRIRAQDNLPAHQAKKHRRRPVLDVDIYANLIAEREALAMQKLSPVAVPIIPEPRTETAAQTWDEYDAQTRAAQVTAPVTRSTRPATRTHPLLVDDLVQVCAEALPCADLLPEHVTYAARADARLLHHLGTVRKGPSRDRARRYLAVGGEQERGDSPLGFALRDAAFIDRALVALRIPLHDR